MISSRSSSASEEISKSERHERALDAAGHLKWHYMQQSRAIIREDLPTMERSVRNCETQMQKLQYLARMRDDSEWAYWAWCYEHRDDVLENRKGGEDPEVDNSNVDFQYAGPYVKPWDYGAKKRYLKRNAHGSPISVEQAQGDLFGTWTEGWQDGPSRLEEDPLSDIGPKGEAVIMQAPPPVGSSWDEVAEMQQKEKEKCEGAEKKGLRDLRQAVGALFGRLRTRLPVSEGKASRPAPTTELASESKGAGTPEKMVDSGYSSPKGKSRS